MEGRDYFVIAVVGLPGSGKTEVTRYLEAKGLPNVYFGEVVFRELRKLGLPLIQKHERPMREKLRREHGMGAIALLSMPEIKAHFAEGSVLIESHYSWEEYLVLREEFGRQFRVIGVWAAPETRYARLIDRPVRPLTMSEAWERDKSQIEQLHQAGPIVMADHTLINEGTLAELQAQAERAYQAIIG